MADIIIPIDTIITAEMKAAEGQYGLRTEFTAAIQTHLDTTARQRQYDGMQTAITYRGDPNPRFAAEADALFVWRSVVWTRALIELAKIEAAERNIPTVADFIAGLPVFEYPPLHS